VFCQVMQNTKSFRSELNPHLSTPEALVYGVDSE